jgi:dUTPase
MNEKGVIPVRNGADVGYDFTITHIIDTHMYNFVLHGTDIIIIPTEEMYIEINAKSSFCMMGYMFSNSVGIIDPSYRKEIIVSLSRISAKEKQITLLISV